ncbi:hypothetical protein MPTK1_5g23680 [Marchantia polymorpha subsp. ruderalis]|uniref:Uncharacterized protein n=2 Tax=Marchantia polymorpha TaxID=3197 RepID=A0AAF6BLK0_MARPO|nr:hypothetical protein MARPO_0010s0088 [Marchantia polymorpha]PTQ46690.1 hypothetical protein MARPO_0010s0088 [Marchantia polymorpha]BBN12884.1 hypothetical protein Mp_5g23680 [Marchantia polymorpha subsp. ruderalis]BBN12885.1 hypothetical protein Mp_5g23680 [Marchantia polymorpha subsp. ruderalis]|eukprot:PTQ46689.1 hypothetical protein MARPO_0010s0088 [Marchantia polymorpha]
MARTKRHILEKARKITEQALCQATSERLRKYPEEQGSGVCNPGHKNGIKLRACSRKIGDVIWASILTLNAGAPVWALTLTPAARTGPNCRSEAHVWRGWMNSTSGSMDLSHLTDCVAPRFLFLAPRFLFLPPRYSTSRAVSIHSRPSRTCQVDEACQSFQYPAPGRLACTGRWKLEQCRVSDLDGRIFPLVLDCGWCSGLN